MKLPTPVDFDREWLVASGWAYASDTTAGANTRTYHGLLVAGRPERKVLLAKLGEEFDGEPLSTNEFGGGTLYPQGRANIFYLEYGIPTWEYPGLVKRVWMQGDSVHVSYTGRGSLRVRPFTACRSYHGGSREEIDFPMRMPGARWVEDAQIWDNFLYRRELERGLPHNDDLDTSGYFELDLSGTAVFSAGLSCIPEPDFEGELARRKAMVGGADPFMGQLLLAADAFVGEGIVAGYHWFTEWGRDALISLPGLLLSTGRYEKAREMLLRYAEGIPNRMTDGGVPEYNTADAGLWYFEAVRKYIEATGDRGIVESLPLSKILDGYTLEDGHVVVGPCLTWMDTPNTPRDGAPVEIQALWNNAVTLLAEWTGERREMVSLEPFACEVGLMDRLGDRTLRPNQIFAVALPHSGLPERYHRSVVEAVTTLLTPVGLRTLSPDDPAYRGRYEGGPSERDAAYHQGTVWPWLLGPYADAHYRVHGDPGIYARLSEPFRKHLTEACVGSVSELFDGDPPHAPKGAVAQAWSVAEILRIVQVSRSKP
ncbi:MAG: amylo-alpha-1,6-glucosidase [Armatimonadota bacterium]